MGSGNEVREVIVRRGPLAGLRGYVTSDGQKVPPDSVAIRVPVLGRVGGHAVSSHIGARLCVSMAALREEGAFWLLPKCGWNLDEGKFQREIEDIAESNAAGPGICALAYVGAVRAAGSPAHVCADGSLVPVHVRKSSRRLTLRERYG